MIHIHKIKSFKSHDRQQYIPSSQVKELTKTCDLYY